MQIPQIDPLDKGDENLICDLLETDHSFHLLESISYLASESEFDEKEAYDMLSGLYQVGVGNYILDIIYYNSKTNKLPLFKKIN